MRIDDPFLSIAGDMMPVCRNSLNGSPLDGHTALLKHPWVPYVLPFGLFLGLTVPAGWFPEAAHLFYFAKTVLVGALLWYWWPCYRDDFAPGLSRTGYLVAIVAGLLVLPAWILPEAFLPRIGMDAGFDPYALGASPALVPAIIGVRLLGAALVVPVMEELFWRSFLQRYLVHTDFKNVALGTFTWFSFIAVVVVFGLEHNRWIQGMSAGVVYGLLVVRQKNIRGCVIAHAVTNLGLGIYVIATGNWVFW